MRHLLPFWVDFSSRHFPIFLLTFWKPPKVYRDLSGCQEYPLKRQVRKVSFPLRSGDRWGDPKTPLPPSLIIISGQRDPLWKVKESQRNSNLNSPASVHETLSASKFVLKQKEITHKITYKDSLVQLTTADFNPWNDYHFPEMSLFSVPVTLTLQRIQNVTKKYFFAQSDRWRGRRASESLELTLQEASNAWQQFLFCRFCFYKEQGQQSSLSSLSPTGSAPGGLLFFSKGRIRAVSTAAVHTVGTSLKIWNYPFGPPEGLEKFPSFCSQWLRRGCVCAFFRFAPSSPRTAAVHTTGDFSCSCAARRAREFPSSCLQ